MTVLKILLKICVDNKIKFENPFNNEEDLKLLLYKNNIPYTKILNEFQKS